MEKPNVKVIYHPGYGFQYVSTKTETSEEDYPCEPAPHKESNMETIEAIDRIRQDLKALNLATFELKEVNRLIERAFRASPAEQADPLAGYSNLTEAISAGEPIDWERLDGLKVQCVNPDVGTLEGKLERRESAASDSPDGWRKSGMDFIYVTALIHSWRDEDGWTLWIEGEVPLHRKTADQLDEGRCFLGKQGADFDPELMIVVGFTEDPKLNKIKPLGEHPGYLEPWQVEVLEEYGIGTFQKPEGK